MKKCQDVQDTTTSTDWLIANNVIESIEKLKEIKYNLIYNVSYKYIFIIKNIQ